MSNVKTANINPKKRQYSAQNQENTDKNSLKKSDSFSQPPLVKSPRSQRKSKNQAKENIQNSYIDVLSQNLEKFKKSSRNETASQSVFKEKISIEPHLTRFEPTQTQFEQSQTQNEVSQTEFEPTQPIPQQIQTHIEPTMPESIRIETQKEVLPSTSEGAKKNSSKIKKKTPRIISSETDSDENQKDIDKEKSNTQSNADLKFTNEYLGKILVKIFKNQKKIQKQLNKIETQANIDYTAQRTEDEVIYKNVNLAELPGSDPLKFARNVAKKLFNKKEIMTNLLPLEPVFEVGHQNDQESEEESNGEIEFPENKGFLKDRKVKLMIDAIKTNQNLSNGQIKKYWPSIRASVHGLGRSIKMEYVKNKVNMERKKTLDELETTDDRKESNEEDKSQIEEDNEEDKSDHEE